MRKLLREFCTPPMAAWAITPLLVLLFAVVPATSIHLDDNSAERAQADSLNDAIKAAQAKERFARAAAQICGNAGWVEVGDGSIQCITRIGGRKALVAKVTP